MSDYTNNSPLYSQRIRLIVPRVSRLSRYSVPWLGLTESTDEKWNKIPCPCAEHLVSMQSGQNQKDYYEEHRSAHRRIIIVKSKPGHGSRCLCSKMASSLLEEITTKKR